MCSSPRPNFSTAPLSTKAIAWIGLLAERGRMRASMSPHEFDDRAVGLHDRRGAFMPALDDRTAGDFDDDGTLAHTSCSSLMIVTLSCRGVPTASTASIRRLRRTCSLPARWSAVIERQHTVTADQQAVAWRERPAAFVDQRQRMAHHRLAQGVAAGMLRGFLGGDDAARHQRLDLRHHRMIRVQSLEPAVRHQEQRRIADADPAHLGGTDDDADEGRAHALERRIPRDGGADRLVGGVAAPRRGCGRSRSP